MKLLFDQNLSPKLVYWMSGWFPGSAHVSTLGLNRATDLDVWLHARKQGFVLVTKDADFGEMSLLKGAPPKVIWLRTGNFSTGALVGLLQSRVEVIREFGLDSAAGVLTLQ